MITLFLSPGCTSSNKSTQRPYKTADTNLTRDTARARTLHAQALNLQSHNPELIGNLARTKHQRGDKDDEQRKPLEDLLLKDSCPD